MPKTQDYKSHRRFLPMYHYFVMPILYVNVMIRIWRLFGDQSFESIWAVAVALALVFLGFAARIMALTAQNRVIRLEERARLTRLMPAEDAARIDELATRHLIGLRFASDEEAADLARRCLGGELASASDVKRNIRTWRPDHLRV